ncbi:helix-turn-helix transcriptional regulator [Modicisalibacter tunisiensis]|uniref:helix-turn-helix transcriptional regulator n=1 Tax=Modicisalibacter tunisiensis TaxID=390637 RepID=UPI001CCDF9FE|nr:AlpA family phage regulatory protein [Modicisalibacter tunisiensis]
MTIEKARTFLTAKQVAARYDVGVATIWRWSRDRDDFPKPKKLGDNCTRWRLSDLEHWEDEREVA